MKKTLVSLAIAAVSLATAPAFADAAIPQKMQFTHEGVTYIFTKTQVGQSTIYKGTANPGQPFYLVEHKGQVTGKVNDMSVSFPVPQAHVATGAKSVPLASR